MESNKQDWNIQVEKAGVIQKYNGKPYFVSKEKTLGEILLAAKEFMLKQREDER